MIYFDINKEAYQQKETIEQWKRTYLTECTYEEYKELQEGKRIWQGNEIVINPNYEEQKLQEAKDRKYKEANDKAEKYLGGEALFEFEKDGETYHIEATDGNIAKIGLKATALLIAQDFETNFPWNTKENTNIMINALEGKAIAEGLGAIQDLVWTVQFNDYIEAIKEATTVEEVEAIEIVYTSDLPEE